MRKTASCIAILPYFDHIYRISGCSEHHRYDAAFSANNSGETPADFQASLGPAANHLLDALGITFGSCHYTTPENGPCTFSASTTYIMSNRAKLDWNIAYVLSGSTTELEQIAKTALCRVHNERDERERLVEKWRNNLEATNIRYVKKKTNVNKNDGKSCRERAESAGDAEVSVSRTGPYRLAPTLTEEEKKNLADLVGYFQIGEKGESPESEDFRPPGGTPYRGHDR